MTHNRDKKTFLLFFFFPFSLWQQQQPPPRKSNRKRSKTNAGIKDKYIWNAISVIFLNDFSLDFLFFSSYLKKKKSFVKLLPSHPSLSLSDFLHFFYKFHHTYYLTKNTIPSYGSVFFCKGSHTTQTQRLLGKN